MVTRNQTQVLCNISKHLQLLSHLSSPALPFYRQSPYVAQAGQELMRSSCLCLPILPCLTSCMYFVCDVCVCVGACAHVWSTYLSVWVHRCAHACAIRGQRRILSLSLSLLLSALLP